MSLPAGPQYSAVYVLQGPDGTRAVLNDPTDADYIGVVTEITGLDSPDVRENADDLVQMDGGIHGDFFYGRRPIVLSGMILNPASADDRNRKMTKLMQASNAMRGDATLTWTLANNNQQFVSVRRQQPLRITDNWQKTFQCSLVAADPRIYSTTLNQITTAASAVPTNIGRIYDKSYDIDYGGSAVAGGLLISNDGNAITYPILTVTGPGSNPQILNYTTGESINLIYTLAAGEYITIDTLNRTVKLGGTTSRYSAIDFTNTKWWGLVPGLNDIRQGWTSQAGASLTVQWRSAWV